MDFPIALRAATAAQNVRLSVIAAYALQVYDWLICLSDEHLYVHKARWSSIKIMYLMCRYLVLFLYHFDIWVLVGNHSPSLCVAMAVPMGLYRIFVFAVSTAVFLIRTYAWAGRNKFILAFLVACYLAIFVYATVLRFTLFGYHWPHKLLGDGGCLINPKPGETRPSEFFIHMTIFDAIMTAIVFFHYFRHWRYRCPLGKAFVTQGLVAFVLLSALSLATTILKYSPNMLLRTTAILMGPVNCVIACRLILMLRREADPNSMTQIHAMSEQANAEIAAIADFGVESTTTDDEPKNRHQPIERWD